MTTLASLLDTLGIASSSVRRFIQYDTGPSFLLSTDGADALPTWYALRRATTSTGFCPILVGDLGNCSEHECHLRESLRASGLDHIPVAANIASSLSADPLSWFRSRAQRHDRLYQSSYAAQEPPFAFENNQVLLDSAKPVWRLQSDPYIVERNTFSIPTEVIYPPAEDSAPRLLIQPAPSVYLALFPTQTAWHIPAYLAYDACNNRPSLDSQLLVWRWWGSQHNAEIVGIAGSLLEAWVVAPPIASQQIERLVWEQRVYCPDITNLVNDLQTDLTGAFVWRFWWD